MVAVGGKWTLDVLEGVLEGLYKLLILNACPVRESEEKGRRLGWGSYGPCKDGDLGEFLGFL